MIAEPLTMLQCCPTSDGAGPAIIGGDRGPCDDQLVEASTMAPGVALPAITAPYPDRATQVIAEIAT